MSNGIIWKGGASYMQCGGSLVRVQLLNVAGEPITPEQRTIAAAFQRHIDERHGADFEVCADAECQRAVALEAGIEYPD